MCVKDEEVTQHYYKSVHRFSNSALVPHPVLDRFMQQCNLEPLPVWFHSSRSCIGWLCDIGFFSSFSYSALILRIIFFTSQWLNDFKKLVKVI